MLDLPPPIACFIDRTNAGDAAGLIECFTPNAVIIDWGRRFEGLDGVAAWDKTDNTGVQSRIRPTAVTPIRQGYRVSVVVSGAGYNGAGEIEFGLSNDRISSIEIKA